MIVQCSKRCINVTYVVCTYVSSYQLVMDVRALWHHTDELEVRVIRRIRTSGKEKQTSNKIILFASRFV